MTICIGVKVNDCIVFVADSATTMLGTNAAGETLPTRVYNHADKVFNLYRGLPVFAMTCGLGNFGSESIATIAKEIRCALMAEGSQIHKDNYTIEAIIRFSFDHFVAKYNAIDAAIRNSSTFEFFVGGYSTGANGSEIWKFSFSAGTISQPQLIVGVNQCDIIWAGQPEACVRLVLGISSSTYGVLREAGLDESQASDLLGLIQQRSVAPLMEPAMPVIDAVKLGEFLAQTTASFVKFLPGADTVRGELDIATVTRYEGFRWIRRKHFYPMALNGVNDHVR